MNEIQRVDVGFTQIKNEVLQDANLSFKAKGLFAYFYSKPLKWYFSSERISDETKDGVRAIKSAIKELESAGYLLRKKQSDGRIKYYISWAKKPECQKGVLAKKPKCRNRTMLKPHDAKTALISNKDKNKIKKNYNNKDIATASVADKISILEETKRMISDKNRHIQVIGIYIIIKKPRLETKSQLISFIKRNLRPAKLLEPYSHKRLRSTMKYLVNNADFKWTLETVGKYIDEIKEDRIIPKKENSMYNGDDLGFSEL